MPRPPLPTGDPLACERILGALGESISSGNQSWFDKVRPMTTIVDIAL